MPKSIRLTLALFGGLTVATGLDCAGDLSDPHRSTRPSIRRQSSAIRSGWKRTTTNACNRPPRWPANCSRTASGKPFFPPIRSTVGWRSIWPAITATRLPPQILNPRINFQSGAATLACTYRHAGHETVMSIAFDLYLSEPNVVALRLRRVRAGLLPVPLADVLRAIAEAGHSFGLMVQWRQVSGDPVALVHLSHSVDDDGRLQLEAIELRDGEIFIAGRTLPPSPESLARRERLTPSRR